MDLGRDEDDLEIEDKISVLGLCDLFDKLYTHTQSHKTFKGRRIGDNVSLKLEERGDQVGRVGEESCFLSQVLRQGPTDW